MALRYAVLDEAAVAALPLDPLDEVEGAQVVNGAALCPCHGSSFGLDGQVLRGPALEGLRARAVAVRGGEIVAG